MKINIWLKRLKIYYYSEDERMILSILTATYNRAQYLQRIYESIINNQKTSNLEAEWIVIDDGSTDNSRQVIEKLIKKNHENATNSVKNKITISYIYQQNQGKMVAINKGMGEATGELIIDCDSDDYFADKAFNVIETNAPQLLQNPELYALCFLKQDAKGNISGKKFEINYQKSTMFDLYFKQNIQGEKILVFNTSIRKKFKHELEENEKFVTEARMYHKMDQSYKILCINQAIEIGDYIEDGYTKNIAKTFKGSPRGYYKYFKEILKNGLKGVKLKKKLYIFKHFVYFWILCQKSSSTLVQKNRQY